MKSSSFIGVVAGLALGATLGILFAPDKGEKTRKKIADKSKDTKDKLKSDFDEFIETAADKYASIKEEGEAFLKSKKQDLKNNIKKEVEKA